MKYKTESINVVIVTENALPLGLYDVSGATRIALVASGKSLPGLYAPNGALYVTLEPGTAPYGQIAPDGSWYVSGSSGAKGVYTVSGGERIAP